MAKPTTYAEWSALLDKFGQGDDTVIEEMYQGSFVVDAGTASRFYAKVEEAYRTRKKTWLEKFQRSFRLKNIKTGDDFGIVLRDGKQNLLPLSKYIATPGFPEDLRKTLQKDLETYVSEIRKSLKDNVSKETNNREKILMAVSTFGLFENTQNMPLTPKPDSQDTINIIHSTGRKIIF